MRSKYIILSAVVLLLFACQLSSPVAKNPDTAPKNQPSVITPSATSSSPEVTPFDQTPEATGLPVSSVSGANAAPQSGVDPLNPLVFQDLREFFLSAKVQGCQEFDDKDASSSQAVSCNFVEANVVYYQFVDRAAQDAFLTRMWQSANDPANVKFGKWYAEGSQMRGEYAQFIFKGQTTLAWTVFSTTLAGVAWRGDADQRSLTVWWQNTGNTHTGSQGSQLDSSLVGSQAPAAPNSGSPQADLTNYYANIADNACTTFDDQNPSSLISIRCTWFYTDTGQTVTINYYKWSKLSDIDKMGDYAINLNPGCSVQTWHEPDNMGLQIDKGGFYMCITKDNKQAYLEWNDTDRLFEGFAVANNNNLDALYQEWQNHFSRHR